METVKHLRNEKIHGGHQKIFGHYNGGRDEAWLNVSGLWLEQVGFKKGDGVVIQVQGAQLVI